MGVPGFLARQHADGRLKSPDPVATPAGPQGGDLSALFDVAGIDNTETLKLTGELDKQINLRLNQLNNLPTLQERFGEKRGNRFARRLDKVFGGQGTTERMFQEKIQTKLLGEVIQLSREKRQLIRPMQAQAEAVLEQIGHARNDAERSAIVDQINADPKMKEQFNPVMLEDFRLRGGETGASTLNQAHKPPEVVDRFERARKIQVLASDDAATPEAIDLLERTGTYDANEAALARSFLTGRDVAAAGDEPDMITTASGLSFESTATTSAVEGLVNKFDAERWVRFRELFGLAERVTTSESGGFTLSDDRITTGLGAVVREHINERPDLWIRAGQEVFPPFAGDRSTDAILFFNPELQGQLGDVGGEAKSTINFADIQGQLDVLKKDLESGGTESTDGGTDSP